jgi:hypothetical protein
MKLKFIIILLQPTSIPIEGDMPFAPGEVKEFIAMGHYDTGVIKDITALANWKVIGDKFEIIQQMGANVFVEASRAPTGTGKLIATLDGVSNIDFPLTIRRVSPRITQSVMNSFSPRPPTSPPPEVPSADSSSGSESDSDSPSSTRSRSSSDSDSSSGYDSSSGSESDSDSSSGYDSEQDYHIPPPPVKPKKNITVFPPLETFEEEDEEYPTSDESDLAPDLNNQYRNFIQAKVAFHNRHMDMKVGHGTGTHPKVAHYLPFGMPKSTPKELAGWTTLKESRNPAMLYVTIGPDFLTQLGAFSLLATLLDKVFLMGLEEESKQHVLLYLCFAPTLSSENVLDFFRQVRLLPPLYHLFQSYRAVIVLISAFNQNLLPVLMGRQLTEPQFNTWFNEQKFWLEVETLYSQNNMTSQVDYPAMSDYITVMQSLLNGYPRVLRFEEAKKGKKQYRNCFSVDEYEQGIKKAVKGSFPLVYVKDRRRVVDDEDSKRWINEVDQYFIVVEAHRFAFNSWGDKQKLCYDALERIRKRRWQGRGRLSAELSQRYGTLVNEYKAAWQLALKEHPQAVSESRKKFFPSLGRSDRSGLAKAGQVVASSALSVPSVVAAAGALTVALPTLEMGTGYTAYWFAATAMSGFAFPLLLVLMAAIIGLTVLAIDTYTKPKLAKHAVKLRLLPIDSREMTVEEFQEKIGELAYYFYNEVPEDLQKNDTAFVRLVFTDVQDLELSSFWFGEIMRILRGAIKPPRAVHGHPIAQNTGGGEGFLADKYNKYLRSNKLMAVHSAFRIYIPYAWLAAIGGFWVAPKIVKSSPDVQTLKRFLQSLPIGIYIEFDVSPITSTGDVNAFQQMQKIVLELIQYIATDSFVSFALPGFTGANSFLTRTDPYGFKLQIQTAGLLPSYAVRRDFVPGILRDSFLRDWQQTKVLVGFWQNWVPASFQQETDRYHAQDLSLPQSPQQIKKRSNKLIAEANRLRDEKKREFVEAKQLIELGFDVRKRSTQTLGFLDHTFLREQKLHLLAVPEDYSAEISVSSAGSAFSEVGEPSSTRSVQEEGRESFSADPPSTGGEPVLVSLLSSFGSTSGSVGAAPGSASTVPASASTEEMSVSLSPHAREEVMVMTPPASGSPPVSAVPSLSAAVAVGLPAGSPPPTMPPASASSTSIDGALPQTLSSMSGAVPPASEASASVGSPPPTMPSASAAAGAPVVLSPEETIRLALKKKAHTAAVARFINLSNAQILALPVPLINQVLAVALAEAYERSQDPRHDALLTGALNQILALPAALINQVLGAASAEAYKGSADPRHNPLLTGAFNKLRDNQIHTALEAVSMEDSTAALVMIINLSDAQIKALPVLLINQVLGAALEKAYRMLSTDRVLLIHNTLLTGVVNKLSDPQIKGLPRDSIEFFIPRISDTQKRNRLKKDLAKG